MPRSTVIVSRALRFSSATDLDNLHHSRPPDVPYVVLNVKEALIRVDYPQIDAARMMKVSPF